MFENPQDPIVETVLVVVLWIATCAFWYYMGKRVEHDRLINNRTIERIKTWARIKEWKR